MPATTAISPHIREVLERCVRRADDNVKVITRNASTQDIIDLMLHCDTLISDDMQELAQYLEGTCPEETMSNIHFVLTQCVEFVEDPNGKQDLMAPNALLKRGYGDCKSFSLFIASVCQSLNIPYIYRFVSETATGNVHHVYVVAPLADGYEVICDATLDRFNTEPPYAKSIDHIMVADDAQEKVVEEFYSKRGEKMPQSKAVADNDAEGNRSVNAAHIGDITDRWIFKLVPNKRDELRQTIKENITLASPMFLYLFYYKLSFAPQKPLSRAALYKLKTGLQLFIDFSTAFSFTNYPSTFQKLIIDCIDAYFKNQSTFKFGLLLNTETYENVKIYTNSFITNVAAETINDWLHPFAIESYPAQVSPFNMVDFTYEIPLNEATLCKLFTDLMRLPKRNGGKVADDLEMMPLISDTFRDYQVSKNAPANLQTPEDVLTSSFQKSVADNCWSIGYYTGKSSNGNLVVFCKTTGNQQQEFLQMYPAGRFVYLDVRFYTGDASLASVPRVCKVVKALVQGNLVALELDAPALAGNSQNCITGIFKLPSIFTTKEAAQQYIDKLLPSIGGMERKTAVKAASIALQKNGSYIVKFAGDANNYSFDPDGLPVQIMGVVHPSSNEQFLPFTTKSETAYISGKIGFPPAIIAAIIGAVVSILGMISSLLSVVLSKPETFSPPNGESDFRYDPNSCVWYNQAQCIVSCELPDGSRVLVDTLDCILNPGVDPELGPDDGQGENQGGGQDEGGGLDIFKEAGSALLLLGGTAMLLLSGTDKKPKRKTTRRKVNGRTYTLARRKWKKRT